MFNSLKSLQDICNAIVDDLVSNEVTPQATEVLEKIYEPWRDPLNPTNEIVASILFEGSFGYAPSPVGLHELAQEQILHPDLIAALEELQMDHNPYLHQVEAYRQSKRGRSILVSSGTGSGKTETFLYPLISDLLYEKDEVRSQRGVRSLLLYPTNALINSQKERLSALLSTINNNRDSSRAISFALYNSALPENLNLLRKHYRQLRDDGRITEQEYNRELELLNDPDLSKTERRTRQDLRNNPPDILITNYSMLDYLQLRSKDLQWIERSNGMLRHFVLDEAHSYQGTMALEIALQIRRTLINFGVDRQNVKFFATSATFGGTNSKQVLENFAADFFDQDQTQVEVIFGHRQMPVLASQFNPWELPDLETLVTDLEQGPINPELLVKWGAPKVSPEQLPILLNSNPSLRRLREECAASPKTLRELSQILWNQNDNLHCRVTALLVDALALVKYDQHKLFLPSRWHAVLQRPAPLRVCINPDCNHQNHIHAHFPEFSRVVMSSEEKCLCGALMFPLALCAGCGELHFTLNLNRNNATGLAEIKALELKQLNLPGASTFHYATILPVGQNPKDNGLAYWMDPITGLEPEEDGIGIQLAIYPPRERNGDQRIFPHHCGILPAHVYRTEGWLRSPNLSMDRTNFYTIQGLLPNLPVHHQDHDQKPHGGRRLLTFQDSRQSAAKLPPMIERFYRQDSLRWALWLQIQNSWKQIQLGADTAEENFRLDRQINQLFTQCNSQRTQHSVLGGSRPNPLATEIQKAFGLLQPTQLDDDQKREYLAEIVMDTVRRPAQRTSTLESSGLVKIDYLGLGELPLPTAMSTLFDLDPQSWRNFLRMILDYARQRGALFLSEEIEATVNQIYGWDKLKTINKKIKPSLAAVNREKGEISLFGNRIKRFILAWLQKVHAPAQNWYLSHPDFNHYLEIFRHATVESLKLLTHALRQEDDGNFCIQAQSLMVLPMDPVAWKCRRTGRIFTYNILGLSIDTCAETLEVLPEHEIPLYLRRQDHAQYNFFDFPVQYFQDLSQNRVQLIKPIRRILGGFSPIIAQEDTAQLNALSNLHNESKFKEGFINLLSSTTTMEMGVDIGQLSSVICVGAPPSPSNYLQRAGRAGRRGEGSTLILTITDQNPHDQHLASHPKHVFESHGFAPEINFDRTLVVERHLHFHVLSNYFKQSYHHTNHAQAFGTAFDFFAKGLTETQDLDQEEAYQGQEPAPEIGEVSSANSVAFELIQSLSPNGQLYQELLDQDNIQKLLKRSQINNREELGNALARMRDKLDEIRNQWEQTYSALGQYLQELQTQQAQAEPTTDQTELLSEISRINRALIRHLGKDYQDPSSKLILNHLARNSFLPIYGLPIHVTRAEIYEKTTKGQWKTNSKYSLERDLSLALSEYAPDSQITVGGKSYTIMGIAKNILPGRGQTHNIGIIEFLYQCDDCGYSIVSELDRVNQCPSCDSRNYLSTRVLKPKGFVTSTQYSAPTSGYERTTKRPRVVLGYNQIGMQSFQNGAISQLFTDAPIHFVQNGTHDLGYHICKDCGCAEAIYRGINHSFMRDYDKDQKSGRARGHRHILPYAPKSNISILCKSENSIESGIGLYHSQLTDMIVINAQEFFDPRIWDLEYTPPMDAANSTEEQEEINQLLIIETWCQALRYAASQILRLSPSELGVTQLRYLNQNHPVIYERASGGAGLCIELHKHAEQLLHLAYQHLYQDEEHHVNCEVACTRCLLSHDTRYLVQRKKLHRKTSMDYVLEKWRTPLSNPEDEASLQLELDRTRAQNQPIPTFQSPMEIL